MHADPRSAVSAPGAYSSLPGQEPAADRHPDRVERVGRRLGAPGGRCPSGAHGFARHWPPSADPVGPPWWRSPAPIWSATRAGHAWSSLPDTSLGNALTLSAVAHFRPAAGRPRPRRAAVSRVPATTPVQTPHAATLG